MTIRNHIIQYLSKGPDWGGTICRAVHDLTKSKEAVIERRLREMAEEGLLDKCYRQVGNTGPHCVRYRLHQKPVIQVKPRKIEIEVGNWNVTYPVPVRSPQGKLF